jgi:hypothetical protein
MKMTDDCSQLPLKNILQYCKNKGGFFHNILLELIETKRSPVNATEWYGKQILQNYSFLT